jgi:hypothetical protein
MAGTPNAPKKTTHGSIWAGLGVALGAAVLYVMEHHVVPAAQAQTVSAAAADRSPSVLSGPTNPLHFATSAEVNGLALEVRAYRGEVAGVLERLQGVEGELAERRGRDGVRGQGARNAALRPGGEQ